MSRPRGAIALTDGHGPRLFDLVRAAELEAVHAPPAITLATARRPAPGSSTFAPIAPDPPPTGLSRGAGL